MKYIELFENFKETKYDQMKPLPSSASCNIDNEDQLNAIINILEQRDYENGNNTTMFTKPDNILSIAWCTREVGWFSHEDQKISKYVYYTSLITEEDEDMHNNIIFFNEYFKFKPKFRGHKLKKFGV